MSDGGHVDDVDGAGREPIFRRFLYGFLVSYFSSYDSNVRRLVPPVVLETMANRVLSIADP